MLSVVNIFIISLVYWLILVVADQLNDNPSDLFMQAINNASLQQSLVTTQSNGYLIYV